LVAPFGDGYRSLDFWCYDEPNGRPILYRIHNLEAQGAARIAELFRDGLLRGLAARFLGTPTHSTVCAMVVKTRGGAGVPWHRDRDNVPPSAAVNLSVYLDPSDESNGCFEAVPGSHRLPDGLDG
jgi:phytanoyl-CoA hydroxylase